MLVQAVDVIQDSVEQASRIIQDCRISISERYIGVFTCTAYAYTGSPTASGKMPSEKHTVACNSLPFGTEIYIEDMGRYIVEDRGASWHSDNWLDIYMGDVDSCIQWGKQEREVYILNWE